MSFESLVAGQKEVTSLMLELWAITPPAMRDEVIAEARRLEVEADLRGMDYRGTHAASLRVVLECMKRTGTPYVPK